MNKKIFLKRIFLLCLAVVCVLGASAFGFAGEDVIFEFDVVETEEMSGRFSTLIGPNREILVDWGDGTQERFSGANQAYRKDFGEPTTTTVKIYARNEVMFTGFRDRNARLRFDIKDMPVGLALLSITGANIVKGDITELSPLMKEFRVYGRDCVIGGKLSDLSRDMEVFDVRGRNLISGDVADLPRKLVSFSCSDGNTVSGDVADLPRGLTNLACSGENTIGGDIAGLPEELDYFSLYGMNTLSGNLGDLPAKLDTVRIAGENTVTGDIADIPEGVIYLHLVGGKDITYTGGREWADNMRQIVIDTELTTEEVDDLLIDLSNAKWIRGRPIRLLERTAPRSERSDSAVEKLEEMGVSVGTR